MAKLITQYQNLPDIRIAYHEHGSGQPLILLHGNSGSKNIFRQYQLEHFSMFHTYALDSRGHGQSQSQDEHYSIEQYSQDVIDFSRAKGIRQAAVIGYSDGGNIALWLARKAPEMFPRLVAISPNYLVSGTTAEALQSIRQAYRMMQFFHRLGFKMKKYLMRFELMLNDIGLTEDDLRGIRTNVKILYAEKDMVREDHLQRLAGLIPGASLHKFNNCSHLTIHQKEDAIRVMQDYLLA